MKASTKYDSATTEVPTPPTADPYAITYYPPTTIYPDAELPTHNACKKIPPPHKECPWKSAFALTNGDCPGKNEMCNLKYFKVCGGHWFSKVFEIESKIVSKTMFLKKSNIYYIKITFFRFISYLYISYII